MYYHASQIKNIKILEPRISNHNIPLIYFSDKRENVLVYLSNAVEKFCKENNFKHTGKYSKWGPYGFTEDGIIKIEEYYPNALYETYKGVEGYIYSVVDIPNKSKLKDVPHAYITSTNTEISSVEYIEDAYEEIMREVTEGKIVIIRYNDFIAKNKEWLKKIIKTEYEQSAKQPEYRYFLKSKFSDLINFEE